MERNEAYWDRSIRVVIGIALLASIPWTGLWGWSGLVPLATAAAGWCPLYSALGIRTCRRIS